MNAIVAQEENTPEMLAINDQDDLFAIDDLNRIANERNLKNSQLAKELGMSTSTLSELRSGKYEGRAENFIPRIRNWLDEQKEKAEVGTIVPEDPPHFWSETAMRVRQTLILLKHTRRMGMIYGGAGVGKTLTARAVQETHNEVFIATLKAIDSNARSTLQRIASEIGITGNNQEHYSRRIFQNICSRLTSNSLLIVDEAQHTDIKAIDAIRAIHDDVGCGLVLIGNNPLHRIVFGDASGQLAQLHSRIAICIQIDRPTDKDITELCHQWKVPPGKAADEIRVIAREPGGLRSASNCIRNACMLAQKAAAELTEKDLRAARTIMRPV